MKQNVFLETPRLNIRPFQKDDLSDLCKILSNPRVMKFSLKGAMSEEQVKETLRNYINWYKHNSISMYAVILKEERILIGMCGIYDQVVDGVNEYEIGYRFNEQYWNRGYATEAVGAVKEFGFNNLYIKRFISIIEDANIASKKVALKNGLHVEKKTFFKEIDVLIFSIHV